MLKEKRDIAAKTIFVEELLHNKRVWKSTRVKATNLLDSVQSGV